jgi:hypothetical protein
MNRTLVGDIDQLLHFDMQNASVASIETLYFRLD